MADALIEHRHGSPARDVARTIAKEAPRLADLGAEELRSSPAGGCREPTRRVKAAVKLEKI